MTDDLGTFADLGVPARSSTRWRSCGVTSPFPIQAATLPDALAGRDVLGRGRTGSGKTIAFAIPTVVALANSTTRRAPAKPRALVLVPTRELANQVAEVMRPLAAAMSLRVATVFGGVGQHPQIAALRSGVDILVACPGRLEDLIQQRHCQLDRVEVTVLDEADHMADLGFLPAVTPADGRDPGRWAAPAVLGHARQRHRRAGEALPVAAGHPLGRPGRRAGQHDDPPRVRRDHRRQADRRTRAGRRRRAFAAVHPHQARRQEAGQAAHRWPASRRSNCTATCRRTPASATSTSFSNGTTPVLVATDIAARGIHVDDIALVVHVDPPAEHKAYLHRSGRTARAGSEGVVVTMMLPEQVGDVKSLARAAKIEPIISRVTPGHPMISQLTGRS